MMVKRNAAFSIAILFLSTVSWPLPVRIVSFDGIPNALVKSAEEFIRSVRDDYALAADFQGDGTKEKKLINWLPGVAFESGKFPSVSINYTSDLPSIKTTIVNYDGTTTNQELTVQSGEPEDGKTNIKEQD